MYSILIWLFFANIAAAEAIFITGVAGFIGSALAERLLNENVQVYGCDSFTDYYDVNLKRNRLNNLLDKGLVFFEKDINQINDLNSLFEAERINCIVNLAAQAGVRYAQENPRAYIHANIAGFLEVLELCRAIPTIRLIYASSSSVYGDSTSFPQKESDQLTSVNSLYAATKLTNEYFAKVYNKNFGVRSLGLRFFTVYGPWGRPDMAPMLFTKAIFDQKPISLFGDGQLERDFTYIDDIVDGIQAAIYANFDCDVLNLGKGHPDQVIDLIKNIEDSAGLTATINSLPVPASEVQKTYADISKAKKILNFNPKTSLREGIHKMMSWYRKYYNK